MISEIKHWISITFAIQKFLHFTKTTHHLPNLFNLNFNDSSNILKLLQKKKEKIKLTLQEEKLNLSSHLESKIIVFAIQNWRESHAGSKLSIISQNHEISTQTDVRGRKHTRGYIWTTAREAEEGGIEGGGPKTERSRGFCLTFSPTRSLIGY